MYKKWYVFDGDRPVEAVIRNYTKDDFQELIDVQKESFPPPFPPDLWWNEKQLKEHVERFPEGALCVEIKGEIAGSITGLMIDFDPAQPEHTWSEVTDDGYIRNHDPNGNAIYIVDICVKPAFRKLGLGKWLMQSMYEVVVHEGLERLLGGARMPFYHKYQQEMTAQDYLNGVMEGDIKDPVVTFLLHCGRTPVQVLPNYIEDEESCNYAALMEWENPFLHLES